MANALRLDAAAKQVDTALQKKPSISFLKYYDREIRGTMERRYPLLKIYTKAEKSEYNAAQQQAALAEIATEELIAFEHVGSSSSTPKADDDKQFFTPNMKVVLEEVPKAASVAGSKQQTDQVRAKHMLAFEEPQIDKAISVPTSEAPKAISALHKVNVAPRNNETIQQKLPQQRR